MFIGGIIIGFVKGWLLALILCAAFPILTVAGYFVKYTTTEIYVVGEAAYSKAGASAEQAFTAIRTVKSLKGENFEQSLFEKSLKYAEEVITKYLKLLALSIGIIFMVIRAYNAAGYYFGGLIITADYINPNTDKGYSIGDILIIMFGILFAAMSIGNAAPTIKYFTEGKLAAAQIFLVVDRVPAIKINDETKKKAENIEGKIEFQNVEFAFPTKKEVKILKYISFSVNKNSKVAIVGESG